MRTRSPLCRTTLLTAGSLLIVACSDEPPTAPIHAGQNSRGPSFSQLAVRVPADLRPDERAFRKIAAAVPSFAGFFLSEEKELVVHLVDPAEASAARAAVGRFISGLAQDRRRVGGRPPAVVIRQAEYSFNHLSEWRDRLEGPIFTVEGVVLLDLDERANRLTVGLADEDTRAGAEAVVTELGVPLASVASRSSALLSLRQPAPPPPDVRTFSRAVDR